MKKSIFLIICIAVLTSVSPVFARTIELTLSESTWEIAPGLKTAVWSYNNTVPGPLIRVAPGEALTIKVTNKLKLSTNIHWHGVEVPNDQDGPMVAIPPGKSFTYNFSAPESGTFWYHSHAIPVLTQMDMGLYGAFIVSAAEDSAYSSDQTYVLDDWYLDARGRRLGGTDRDGMERLGNIETVNGKTGNAIEPLKVKKGELHKLRFVNASTAAVHTLKIVGHQFRVTHLDGHPLSAPYLTDTVVLSPGERVDVELAANGEPGKTYAIASSDRDLGLRIPIIYETGSVAAVKSPFVPPASRAFAGVADKKPDYVLELNSRMKATSSSMSGMSGMSGMKHDMSAMSNSMMQNMEWTINGKSYPDTDMLNVKVGQIVKIRFVNKDTGMGHPMDHPMHLHGTYFQVLAVNGKAPDRETWKDTVVVPASGTVDIAFRYKNPGDWMLHCHVIDHEDAGLMTMVKVE